jgi:hypothetical protein
MSESVNVYAWLDEALYCADSLCRTRSREFDHRCAAALYALVEIVRISGVVAVDATGRNLAPKPDGR